MHKGANKQTNQLNKNGNDVAVLNFCYQTCSEKMPAISAQREYEIKLTKGLTKKVSNDVFCLRRVILSSTPVSESR